jgi:hypothetical protein
MKISSVLIDGTLYVLIAVFGVMQAMFTSDEAYKYVNPHILFWGKAIVGIAASAVGALKMFRSTTYAEHIAHKTPESIPKS